MNIASLSGRQVWVVRHGLRRDFIDRQWAQTSENPYDPPLHMDGKTQAEETGYRLEGEPIDYIFTSPFLRTIQTAEIIANRLNKRFFVEDGISEWLKADEFSHQPEVYNKTQIKAKFDHYDGSYRSSGLVLYPEKRESLDRRIEISVESILNKFIGNILIISHASPIDSLFRLFVNEDPLEYQTMCAISRFDRVTDRWTLGIDRDSSHLSINDDRNQAFYRRLGLTR